MKKIEFVFVLIIFNFFVVQSKILYLFCGLLFTPYATERLDELRQLIYIFYLNKIRNAKLRKIIYKLNLFDDQRQGAKKISFIGTDAFVIACAFGDEHSSQCQFFLHSQKMRKARVTL